MALTYSDILAQNAAFQRAVNLSMDQGRLQLVDSYIPTTASASILARFLLAAIQPGADRASILIVPYGKGKSHTLFVAMSVLSEQGDEAEAVFARLAERLELVSGDAANLVRRIRHDAIRLLPVVVNDRYLDIRQAFLASLRTALQAAGLTDIMPDNYFQRCLETISRWKKEYPNTHADYVHYLRTRGEKPEDFEAKLRQFDAAALSIFRDCHQAILSGTAFDPLLESDAPTLYRFVAEALRAKGAWNGLFVVFDEFGKYLESAESGGDRFKALQDLAEMCSRSDETCLMLTCISHKAISEYATNLNQTQRISFRTVEGRFQPIYFTTTFEGSFSLIAGALGRNMTLYAGLSPSTYQSGKLANAYPHMEKRGSRYLRYALFNATKFVCNWDPSFAAYLAKKRAEGKHYNVAISHAAKKLVRLIFALMKSGRPYCPAT